MVGPQTFNKRTTAPGTYDIDMDGTKRRLALRPRSKCQPATAAFESLTILAAVGDRIAGRRCGAIRDLSQEDAVVHRRPVAKPEIAADQARTPLQRQAMHRRGVQYAALAA